MKGYLSISQQSLMKGLIYVIFGRIELFMGKRVKCAAGTRVLNRMRRQMCVYKVNKSVTCGFAFGRLWGCRRPTCMR